MKGKVLINNKRTLWDGEGGALSRPWEMSNSLTTQWIDSLSNGSTIPKTNTAWNGYLLMNIFSLINLGCICLVSIKSYLLHHDHDYTWEGKKYTLKTREKEWGQPTAKFEQLLASISSKRFLALFFPGESFKTSFSPVCL